MSTAKTCPKCGASYGPEVIFCPNDRTVLDESAGQLTGQIIAERYRVIARIGEGGMGEVYLAEHVHMKRKCAVKLLNPELAGDAGAMKRFMREAANASRIDHPNVVTIYDFGEMPDRGAFLAMEFIEGESLRKRIERQRSMPRDVMASIVRQTASALQTAHALGIVHRDLKPDNIMLVERDGELRVKVVDFGIAKARSDKTKVTATGAIVGTPDYMSPEQLLADDVTGAADQYALALVAVKMLTGKLPFATTTSIESMTSRLKTAPMPLRELRQDVAWPQPLQDCIHRALAMEPAGRFPSVTEFSRAFDRTVGGMPGAMAATVPDLKVTEVVVAPRVQTSVEEVRSRRSYAPLAIVAVVVVALGGFGAVWLSSRGSSGAAEEQVVQPVSGTTSGAVHPVLASRTEGQQTAQQGAADTTRTAAAPTSPGQSATATTGSREPVRSTSEPERPPPVEHQRRVDTTPTAPTPPPATAATESRVVPEVRAAPARDTTPPAPTPAVAPATNTISAAEFTSEYSAISSLVVPDAQAAQLNNAVTRANALLPKVGKRDDSIRVLYIRARAQATLGDQPSACRTLASALGLAAGMSTIEERLKGTAQGLNCP